MVRLDFAEIAWVGLSMRFGDSNHQKQKCSEKSKTRKGSKFNCMLKK